MLPLGFEPPTLQRSVHITIYVFNSVLPCWSVFFPIYGRKYSMNIKLFMENMWEFFLVFYFVQYKVNIPMHVGEFFYVFILFYTKLIFPCIQGDWNKSYIRNIFVGYKWKFTFQTKPLWGFATVYFLIQRFSQVGLQNSRRQSFQSSYFKSITLRQNTNVNWPCFRLKTKIKNYNRPDWNCSQSHIGHHVAARPYSELVAISLSVYIVSAYM
jgi:hypothetical protein